MSKPHQPQTETTLPHAHGVGEPATDQEPASDHDSIEAIVRFHSMREQHATLYVTLFEAMTDADKQKILRLTHQRHGVGYDTLYDRIPSTKRTVRKKVKELVEDDVLEKSGKPAFINFASDEARIMAGDVVAVVEDSGKRIA